MIDYADYDFYKSVYQGSRLTREEFPEWAARAGEWIDYLTQGKVQTADRYSDRIKLACCAVAEVVFINETKGGGVTSASNDGYSESYANASSSLTAEQRVLMTARRYLSGTGLLYKGVR